MNPQVLYHYTTVESLMKILDTKSNNGNINFRASEVRSMNDTEEHIHILSIFKEAMIEYENMKSIPEPEWKSSHFHEFGFDSILKMNGTNFVLSLSECEDDLGMWRAYGNNGDGVAIGLNFERLINTKLGYKRKLGINRCVYDDQVKVKNMIDRALVHGYEKMDYAGKRKTIEMSVIEELFRKSPIYKHQAFSLEKEWRVYINVPSPFKNEEIKYRERDGIPIPYIDFFYEKEIVENIIIGPCVNVDLTNASLRSFLYGMGFDVELKQSCVPYRNRL